MSKAPPKRIVMLFSGRGSNMMALGRAAELGYFNAKVAGVFTNKPDAGGIAFAEAAGWPCEVIDHKDYADREAFDEALADAVDRCAPDLVLLAGFMRVLTPVFVNRFAGKVMNIHPSLLPKYPGLHTHARAIEAGDSFGGATVHYVTEALDAGPSIVQVKVPILNGDSPDDLAARVLEHEHQIYALAARWHLEGSLKQEGLRAILDGGTLPLTGMQWEAE